MPKVGYYELIMSLLFDSLESRRFRFSTRLLLFVLFLKRYKEFPKLGTWVRRMRVRKIFPQWSEF